MTSAASAIDALREQLADRVSTPAESDAAIRELGWALVAEGQLFVESTSSDDDVSLFFETYGHPRGEDPVRWVERIASGLQQRTTSGQWASVQSRAVARAAARLV